MRWLYAIPVAAVVWLVALGEPVLLAIGVVVALCAGALWLTGVMRGKD